jgi:hypothetical protein
MTPSRFSGRVKPARASWQRPSAKTRSAPVLVVGMPLSRSRISAVCLSRANRPPGRKSDAWLRTPAAMAEKALASMLSISVSPADAARMRFMSTAARSE